MRTIDAMKKLVKCDHWKDCCIYTKNELGETLDIQGRELTDTITRLMGEEILIRVYHGTYLFAFTKTNGDAVLYQLVKKLQPEEIIYESGFSAASQWGLISQIPPETTFFTTGKEETYDIGFRCIRLTHSQASEEYIRNNIIDRSEFGEAPLANRMLSYQDVRAEGTFVDLMREEYNKCIGGTSGTIRYFSPEDDDTWDFLDPVKNKEDIAFLKTKPKKWS